MHAYLASLLCRHQTFRNSTLHATTTAIISIRSSPTNTSLPTPRPTPTTQLHHHFISPSLSPPSLFLSPLPLIPPAPAERGTYLSIRQIQIPIPRMPTPKIALSKRHRTRQSLPPSHSRRTRTRSSMRRRIPNHGKQRTKPLTHPTRTHIIGRGYDGNVNAVCVDRYS